MLRGKDTSLGNSMINHPGHVTLTSWISLKFLPMVGIIEIWKSWKYYPLTSMGSEFMAFKKNDYRLDWWKLELKLFLSSVIIYNWSQNWIEFSELILLNYCCLIIQYMEFLFEKTLSFLIDWVWNSFKLQAEVCVALS